MRKFVLLCAVRQRVARMVLVALILAGIVADVGCTKETPAATSKPAITRDPDLFEADHPELFQTTKAEVRPLPTIVTANGTVSPDVNRTIHVTSLGAGRVVNLQPGSGVCILRLRKGEGG
jgi:multidrug efflux pump subunit AcrA (membrane-fusion protein)